MVNQNLGVQCASARRKDLLMELDVFHVTPCIYYNGQSIPFLSSHALAAVSLLQFLLSSVWQKPCLGDFSAAVTAPAPGSRVCEVLVCLPACGACPVSARAPVLPPMSGQAASVPAKPGAGWPGSKCSCKAGCWVAPMAVVPAAELSPGAVAACPAWGMVE